MKSEKGITLTSLIIYLGVTMVVVTIVATFTSFFVSNMNEVRAQEDDAPEFNKFSMFFIADVKKNANITSISSSSVTFEDGTKYAYTNGSIYRNDVRIAKYVKQFSFATSNYTVNNVTKKIINVKTEFGKDREMITKDIDFVLKYW